MAMFKNKKTILVYQRVSTNEQCAKPWSVDEIVGEFYDKTGIRRG